MLRSRAWAAVACESWAVVIATLILESAGRLASEGPRAATRAIDTATLLALQAGLQLCALALLMPVRALVASRWPWARRSAPLLVALSSAAGLYDMAAALTSGAWISAQPYAPALRWTLVAGGSIAAAGIVSCAYSSWVRRRTLLHATFLVALAALAIAAVVADRRIYPGQYPEAHLALLGAASLCMQLSLGEGLRAIAAWASAVERLLRRLAVPVAVVSIAALVWLLPPRGDVASSILLTSHRLTLLLRFMPRSRVPQLADELAVIDVREPYRAPAPELPAWTIPADWNVVLVVIDALRADAVPPTLDDRPKPRFTSNDAPFLAALSERSFRFRRTYTSATYTYMAMPAMFLSQPPLQARPGAPLGALMDESGRMSFAVVNDFFAQPIDDHLTQLQAGFAEVRTYSESAQNEQRPLIDALLDEFHARPFFAWLHYYAVHSPGWDGKAVPRMRAEWPENYRKCLRWVDGEIAWLFAKLEKLGIAERTVVVVTADHGEGLMDTGHMYHGPYVYEEAVRVPLLVYVPGKPGRLIDETVGTIDIAPTLVQLVGGRRRSSHAGRSLLPLMFDGRDAPDLPYLFVSGNQQQAGLVRGSDKHIYDRPSGAQLHFDLDDDPLEDRNNYDVRKHHSFVQLLVRHLPELFAGDLDSADTQALLDRRLREADGQKLPAQLRLLLRAIRLSPTPARIAWARRAFERADSDDARLALVAEIGPENLPALAAALRRRLEASRDPDQEALFVDGLADLGVPPFEREFVTQRFSAALAGPRARWLPWLRLTAAWPRASAEEIAPLAALAERFAAAQTERDEVALRMLLAALAMADLRASAHANVAAALERWLAEPRPALRSDAARALGRTEPRHAAGLLRPMLADGDLMVRLGALEGLTSALGTKVFPQLERMTREPDAQATVLRLAVALGTQRSHALLRTLANDAKNQFVRANARRALAALERPEDAAAAGAAASAVPEH